MNNINLTLFIVESDYYSSLLMQLTLHSTHLIVDCGVALKWLKNREKPSKP